jgi:hypothetical protein
MDFIGELIDEVIESVVEERWLAVVGYEGLYEVSDLGRVKSLARAKAKERILKQSCNDGYCRVGLFNKKQDRKLIHRLVLLTFLPLEEKEEVDHINHIKSDNRLENLRWATRSENKRNTNKKIGCSSQYIGVCFNKPAMKWQVDCRINKGRKSLGLFDTEQDAGKAYNAYIIANNLQEFAILNDV